MTDSGSEQLEFTACDHCGRAFDVDVRYPVSVHERPDGDLELYSFCDESCQRAWRSKHQ